MSEQRWREDPGVWWPAPDQNNRAPDSFPYKNFPPPSAAPCVRGYPDYRGVPGRPDGSVAPPGWWPSYPGMDGGMTNAAAVVSFGPTGRIVFYSPSARGGCDDPEQNPTVCLYPVGPFHNPPPSGRPDAANLRHHAGDFISFRPPNCRPF
jgi:hypothetical protein